MPLLINIIIVVGFINFSYGTSTPEVKERKSLQDHGKPRDSGGPSERKRLRVRDLGGLETTPIVEGGSGDPSKESYLKSLCNNLESVYASLGLAGVKPFERFDFELSKCVNSFHQDNSEQSLQKAYLKECLGKATTALTNKIESAAHCKKFQDCQ